MSKSSFIQGKDTYYISLTQLNELKVWDIRKPDGSNLIFEVKHSLQSQTTCWAVFYEKETFLAAVGAENGSVTVWDLTTSDKLAEYSPHRAPVTAITFHGPQIIFSSGEDLDLVKYSRDSKQAEQSHRCSSAFHELHCFSDSILCVGACIEILEMQTLRTKRKFQSEAQPIKVMKVCPKGKYFLGATQDRFIKIWKIPGKGKSNVKPRFQLRCDSNAISLSVHQLENMTKIAAVTDKGHCLLWTLNLNEKRKSKNPIPHHQAICFTSPPSTTTALRAALFQTSTTLTVAQGIPSRPHFHPLTITSDERILLPESQPSSKTSRKRKREAEVDIVGPSDSNAGGVSKKNLKRAKFSPIADPSSSPTPPAEKPSAGSLETLVTQAISTQDQTLFEEILKPKKAQVIRNTVTRLKVEDAEALLSHASGLFRKHKNRGPHLIGWIEELVAAHGLHMTPKCLSFLSSTVDERMKYLQPLLKLQGKVGLLIQRKSEQRKVRAKAVFQE